MSRPVNVIRHPDYSSYSEIIDVRSPSEFAEDHVPGAINLWVLDDEQRVEVGTLYKQVSSFEAKKVGAALVSRNIAQWLEKHFHSKGKDYKPLVYCWRGGQRSMGMATILSRITWDTSLLEGGYKNYRADVREILDNKAGQLKLCVVAGLTGTAKTKILHQLRNAGEQIIDLEGLANHKGSLLGEAPDQPQPSQKYFESLLASEIAKLDENRITWIEAESNKIGRIHCPQSLWENMRQSPIIRIEAGIEQRVQFLLNDYPHFVESPDVLKTRLNYLRQVRGHETVNRWLGLIDTGRWELFVQDVLESHYDLSYQKSIKKNRREALATVELKNMDDLSLKQSSLEIIKHGEQYPV